MAVLQVILALQASPNVAERNITYERPTYDVRSKRSDVRCIVFF